jgi:hypothetical protein
MRSIFILWFLLVALLPNSTSAMDHRALAEHWAPIIYQQTASSTSFKEDQFTAFNYDLDWRGDNNWSNLIYYPTHAVVYYSVHETQTHYFLGSYLYYPRTSGSTKQANIMTGSMLAIAKGSITEGKLSMIATYNDAKWQWQQLQPQTNTSPVSLTVASSSSGSRRIVLAQSLTHHFKGIRYYYGGAAKTPVSNSIANTTSCSYQLLPISILQTGLRLPATTIPMQFATHAIPALKPPWFWGTKTNDLWNLPAESLLHQVPGIDAVSLIYLLRP